MLNLMCMFLVLSFHSTDTPCKMTDVHSLSFAQLCYSEVNLKGLFQSSHVVYFCIVLVSLVHQWDNQYSPLFLSLVFFHFSMKRGLMLDPFFYRAISFRVSSLFVVDTKAVKGSFHFIYFILFYSIVYLLLKKSPKPLAPSITVVLTMDFI
jgi:hypothetical protein